MAADTNNMAGRPWHARALELHADGESTYSDYGAFDEWMENKLVVQAGRAGGLLDPSDAWDNLDTLMKVWLYCILCDIFDGKDPKQEPINDPN